MANKKPADPRGGHSRVYWEIQDSMAWRALSFSAVALYMAMRRKLQSTNNGNVDATKSTLQHANFGNPNTLAKCLRELEAVGLIAKTRQGGIAMGRRDCNLFRFTDEQVFEQPKLQIPKTPATNEWRQFSKLADAERAIEAAHAAVVGTGKGTAKNRTGVRKTYRAGTENVPIAKFSSTDFAPVASSLEQKTFQSARAPSAAKPHAA